MWIKLHRKITEWRWFEDAQMVQLFIYLLAKASYEQRKWRDIVVGRGQVVTSSPTLMKELKTTRQKLRTCLSRLELSGEINIKSTNRYTIITICNYESYQGTSEDEQPSNNHQITISKEIKEREKFISLTQNAPTREEVTQTALVPLDICANMMRTDATWRESVLYNAHLNGHHTATDEDIGRYISLFIAQLKAEGTEAKTYQDARHHFASWLNIQLRSQKSEIRNHADKYATKEADSSRRKARLMAEYADDDRAFLAEQAARGGIP